MGRNKAERIFTIKNVIMILLQKAGNYHRIRTVRVLLLKARIKGMLFGEYIKGLGEDGLGGNARHLSVFRF